MKAQRFLDGTLTGYSAETLSLMRAVWDDAWCVIGHRYEGDAAIAEGRLRLAEAVVTVTPREGGNAEDIKRMALDMVFIVERDLLDR
jgi:hypothetical protein